eukprot:g24304.t1
MAQAVHAEQAGEAKEERADDDQVEEDEDDDSPRLSEDPKDHATVGTVVDDTPQTETALAVIGDEEDEAPDSLGPADAVQSTQRHRSPRRPRRARPPTEEERLPGGHNSSGPLGEVAEAFSEEALRKRAEKQVKRALQLTSMNIPSVSNYPRIFGGNAELRLDAMSTEAQNSFLRVARYEAETWMRQERQRWEIEMRTAKRQAKLLDRLTEWREKKDKAEQAERMRLEKYKPQHLKMTVAGQCIELARLDRQREEQELRERERWTKILA